MLFRVTVPGLGPVFVEAEDSAAAIRAVRQFLNRNQIRLEEGVQIEIATPVNGDVVGIDTVLDSNGVPMNLSPRTTTLPGSASGDFERIDLPSRESGSITAAQSASGIPLVVGKVVFADGTIAFVRVHASDTSSARTILQSALGPAVTIQAVSTPDFLFETDAEFVAMLQGSGQPDLDSFVQSLDLIVEPIPQPEDEPDETDQTEPLATTDLPIDVQAFPFASFQNAVAELGLDPEGVLGSTISQRFDALAPAARVGSLTGTVDPIGQDPGALQQFFSDRFGDTDIAAETFRDLLAGRTSNELNAEDLLSFRALQSPDIATSRGRSDAADVFRLARAAAEDRFGSFVASRLLPSNARLFRELERELAQGDVSTDFLQFARQQNLLPA